jgi:hypothetical protein
MSLLLATQITAVATAVLALFAIASAAFAFMAFRKQSQEVGLLLDRAHRDQAEHVYPWVSEEKEKEKEKEVTLANWTNASQQPVYDVDVSWHGKVQVHTPALLPQRAHSGEVKGPSVTGGTIPVEMEFRDAHGTWWRATSRGELTVLCGMPGPSPADHCTSERRHHGAHSWERQPIASLPSTERRASSSAAS